MLRDNLVYTPNRNWNCNLPEAMLDCDHTLVNADILVHSQVMAMEA